MEINKEKLLEAIELELQDNLEPIKYGMLNNTYPVRGEIVFAHAYSGLPYTFNNQFARVVQIRLGCGQFGSDMYFLRLPNGKLITSENQSFREIPQCFYEAVENHFSTNLDYESDGFKEGYTLGEGKHLKVGFIIHDKNTPGTPDEPFSVTIKSA